MPQKTKRRTATGQSSNSRALEPASQAHRPQQEPQEPIRDCKARYVANVDTDLRERFAEFMKSAGSSNKQLLLGVFVDLWSSFDLEDELSLASAFETTISGHIVAVIPQDELTALRKRVKDLEKIRVFPKAS